MAHPATTGSFSTPAKTKSSAKPKRVISSGSRSSSGSRAHSSSAASFTSHLVPAIHAEPHLQLFELLGDDDCDTLTGGAGADLFIINAGDDITDFKFGKPNKNKDGDVVIKDGQVTR